MKTTINNNLIPFEVKLEGKLPDGKDISPETLSLEKFTLLFGRFRKLVELSLEDDKETLKAVNFRYEKGSAIAVSDIPARAHQIIVEEVRQIEAGHPINFSSPGVAHALLELKELATDMGDAAKITIGTKNEAYIEITKDTQFKQLKNIIVETEEIVYGKLFSVGGKNPNVHLSLGESGDNLIVRVSETQARELAKDLYGEMGAKIAMKQNLLTRERTEARYVDRIPYSQTLDEEKFAQDMEVGTKVWAGIDPVEWTREQRGSIHD